MSLDLPPGDGEPLPPVGVPVAPLAPAVEAIRHDVPSDLTASELSARGAKRSVYDSIFWCSYLANTCMMVGVGILFRYADFVKHVEGSELNLGLIVGAGMTGSLLMRGVQGSGIDRHGPRWVWMISASIFTLAMLGHLLVSTAHGPLVYVLRTLMMIGSAGAIGAGFAHTTLLAPPGRIGEMIGTLGSSGFVGVAIGPIIGDWLFSGDAPIQNSIRNMFLLAACMGLVTFVFAWLATRRDGAARSGTRRHLPTLWIVRKYNPGAILLVGLAIGIGAGLPTTFVRAFTQERGIDNIRTYFLTYAITAFSLRMVTRRCTDRYGVRGMAMLGLFCFGMMLLLFIPVHSEGMLMAPAFAGGVAIAVLFPAAMSGCTSSFPLRHRGLATTLMLAMFDIGNLLGQPLVGTSIYLAERAGLYPYATTFSLCAAGMGCLAIAYGWMTRKKKQELKLTDALNG